MQRIKEFIENYAIAFTRFGLASAAILFFVGSIGAIYSFCDKDEHTLKYDETNSKIDYKVNLLENNSYSESYLVGSPGRSYITNLIDTIDLDYNYELNFDQPVVGNLEYQLVSVSRADKIDGSVKTELWSSAPTNITDKYTVHVNGSAVKIAANTKIAYEDYVKQLSVLEAEARGVVMKGSLNIAMVISGSLKPAGFDQPQAFDTRLDFTIPIASNSSVEAKTALKNGTATLSEIPASMTFSHIIIAIVSILVILLSFAVLLGYLYANSYRNHKYPYEENIRKLLSAYDGIIIAIKKAPSFRGIDVVDVDDFDQLLDLYNSIHQPINHYKIRSVSYFVIVDNNRAWRYTVDKKDFKQSAKKTKN